ncbi:MAG: Tfp pilus assembly protein PilF [Rhodothermales bacterium]|jgi:Tfp pilus assembly protein PilF
MSTRYATLAIIGFALLAHGMGLRNGFTNWDDPQLLLENEQVRSISPGNLLEIFTPQPGHTYQPVRVLSYAIDHALFGYRPFFYHAGNLILHIVAALLLFHLFRRLLSQLPELRSSQHAEIALVAALLFAVHPANVEAVAWVASRKYGLVAVFAFLALHLHLRSSQSTKARVGEGASCAAAMLASPFGVMLPMLMLLLDYGTRRSWDWRRYVPVGVAALIAFGPIGMGLFAEGGISVDIAGDKRHYTILTLFRVIPQYAGILLAPIALNNRYPLDVATSIGDWRVLLGILMMLGFAISAIRAARSNRRWPLVCLGWFGLWWLPVSNILPTMTSMADRYLYLAAPGVFLAAGIGLDAVVKRVSRKQIQRVMIVVLLIFCVLAGRRTTVWHDSVRLWEDCLATTPNNPAALHNLGTHWVKQGDFKNGHVYLSALAALGEDTARLWSNLGVCEMNFGNPAEAKLQFEKAVVLEPEHAGYWLNLATASLGIGDAERAAVAMTQIEAELDMESSIDIITRIVQLRRCDLASPLIERYRQRWPGDFRGARMLGVCWAEIGQLARAMQALQEAARLNPSDPATRALIQKVQAAAAQK